MQIGMIGLGRMGANMVRRLLQGGHDCVAYDPKPEAVQAVSAARRARRRLARPSWCAHSRRRARCGSWCRRRSSMRSSRSCARSLERGDVLIDGGNSNYHDDIRRAR